MRSGLVVITAAVVLAGCATGPVTFPVQATRFHYDAMADRGTIAVEPLPGGGSAPSIEFKTYAAAVQAELLRLGYTSAPPGAKPQFLATVAFTRAPRTLAPRRSPVTIGLGGGGFDGGRGGGVGLGGGVSFPLGGGGGGREGVVTELSVRIRQGPDAVWEGQAQSLTDLAGPGGDTPTIAARLASALFADFPGESGRTIEVK